MIVPGQVPPRGSKVCPENIRKRTASGKRLAVSGKLTGAVLLIVGAVSAWAQPLLRPAPKFQEHKVVTKRLLPKSGDTLVVNNRFGNVSVRAGTGAEIAVRAELTAGGDTRNEAQTCLKTIVLNIEHPAGGILVSAVCPQVEHLGATQFQTDFQMVVPADIPVRIDNAYGDVVCDSLHNPLFIANRFGGVMVRNADHVEIVNAFGNVTAVSVAARLQVRNQLGDVSVRGVTGSCRVVNQDGSVRLSNSQGRTEITNSLGDVFVSGSSGILRVANRAGQIMFEQTAGGADTVALQNYGGACVLYLDQAGSARIDARATNGTIETSLPRSMPVSDAAGTETEDRFSFCLGDGQARFDIMNYGGRIVIETR